ncbi:type IV secretory system conjugative DNA transfer family protein [Fusibacter tunisiensis]|uniref:Type IV secretory pathway TraG/TraD family ATPase VirD4 n=1 Tax=Fusibacter tunisiensis TaxID=1008308 RepID=A0ABS2MU20_9FIRM|nr:type IV secretory system conjugative DNA transfer family protein [Fusibacter tunisiensis]MBM7562850.1 type IV secretory pathway TraG/TraD family ATPase VirD4 [Fusibacter tunisiensis]
MTLILMVIVMIIVSLIAFKDKFQTNNLLFKQVKGFIKNRRPRGSGDIFICKDALSGENIIIPLKDRFLHMLSLGPTGSGKSSLVLLPIISQDIISDIGLMLLEPKGDLAEQVYALAELNGRKALYFNPTFEKCPKFNPLDGNESEVIENMVMVFRMILSESPDFYKDATEKVLRMAVKVLKRTKANPTLLDLDNFLSNNGGIGENILMSFKESIQDLTDRDLYHENANIIQYLTKEYFDVKGEVYQATSSLRTQLSRINSNKYLNNVFNSKPGIGEIDFNKALESGTILAMTTAQGTLNSTLSELLGRLLIINFQSAVMKRKGDENTRSPYFMYIDEFQVYTNPEFADMLTMGRSYRVGTILATQNRQLIAGDGKSEGLIFLEAVTANTRNQILLPDLPYTDAQYFSNSFGTKKSKRVSFGKSGGSKDIGYSGRSKNIEVIDVPVLSPTEIMNQPFGNLTYKIVANNTARQASVGKATFVDADTMSQIKKLVTANNALLSRGYYTDAIDTETKLTKDISKMLDEASRYDDEF